MWSNLKFWAKFVHQLNVGLFQLSKRTKLSRIQSLQVQTISQEHCLDPTIITRKSSDRLMINSEKLNSILQNFVTGVSDIQGAAIVTPDGLSLSSVLGAGMDEERVAAMSAAMLSLGERIGSELARGTLDRILIEGDTGYGFLTNCGSDAVLLVLAHQSAKQGLVQLEIKRLASELKLMFK